jgi:hypothetical protein
MTTRTVERDHELRDEALAVRGLVDQPAELAHELRVATQGQIRVDAELECPRAKLVEALGLGAAVEVQRDAGEDRAVPETQRLLGEGCGANVVAERRCLGSLLYERLEDERVENGRAEADPIPASSSLEGDPVRRERLTKPRHVRLQAVRCGRRRTLAPDVVDEALVGHYLASAEQQSGQNGALFATAQLKGASLDLGFERTEVAEPDSL